MQVCPLKNVVKLFFDKLEYTEKIKEKDKFTFAEQFFKFKKEKEKDYLCSRECQWFDKKKNQCYIVN